jgi:hypothetical protein
VVPNLKQTRIITRKTGGGEGGGGWGGRGGWSGKVVPTQSFLEGFNDAAHSSFPRAL